MKHIKTYKLFEKYKEFDLIEELLLNLKDDDIEISISIHSDLRIMLSAQFEFNPSKYEYELLSVKDYIESNGYKFKLFVISNKIPNAREAANMFLYGGEDLDRRNFDTLFNLPISRSQCTRLTLFFN